MENKLWTDGPKLLTQACCGDRACRRLVIGIINPVMATMNPHECGITNSSEEELIVPICYFPMEAAQTLVDQIRKLAAMKGMTII